MPRETDPYPVNVAEGARASSAFAAALWDVSSCVTKDAEAALVEVAAKDNRTPPVSPYPVSEIDSTPNGSFNGSFDGSFDGSSFIPI